MGFTFFEFEQILDFQRDLDSQKSLAVAVSGGADSMAMALLLSQYAVKRNKVIFAYTVDHGLRAEAADEAKKVGVWLSEFPNTYHKVLMWQGDKPSSRILEEARNARYDLLINEAQDDGCQSLFVAHHRDDQAETFLTRLAKGSGLDGLSCMKPLQEMHTSSGHKIMLLRPFLDVPKEDLIALCEGGHVPFVCDPTNENEKYLRPRLRAAQGVLEEEGLSAKRLATTAKRIARARDALEKISQDLFDLAAQKQDKSNIMFDFEKLRQSPEELILRVLLMAIEKINPKDDYGPRLERVEHLMERILQDEHFKGATLSGCVFSIDRKNRVLSVGLEK